MPGAASLAAALAALSIAAGCSDSGTAVSPTPKLDTEGAVEADELVLDGIDLTDADSALSATRAIFRKRKGGGGFFTYHDLRESVLSETHLAIRSDSASFSFTPLIDYAKDISSLIIRMGAARGRAQSLSRLLFTDLEIRIEYGRSGNLHLTAKKGRFNLDSRSLVLEEAVTVSPPRGKDLAAPIAVLADGHDGVYFPRGYWLDAPPEQKCRVSVVYSPELGAVQELRRICGSTPTYRSTFFTPSERGTLLAAATIPGI